MRRRRQVGAGAGLAEALAPLLLALQHGGQEASLLLLAAEAHDRLGQEPEVPRRRRRVGGAELLVEDALVDRAEAPATGVLRPREAEPSAGVELLVPLALEGDVGLLVVGVGLRRRHVVAQPVAELLAERGFLGGVLVVHAAPRIRMSAMARSW